MRQPAKVGTSKTPRPAATRTRPMILPITVPMPSICMPLLMSKEIQQ